MRIWGTTSLSAYLSARKGHGAEYLEETTQYVWDNWDIRLSQYGFTKGWSYFFYDQVIYLMDDGKAFDTVYLDFSKAFNTGSHSILLEKLPAHGLERYTLY